MEIAVVALLIVAGVALALRVFLPTAESPAPRSQEPSDGDDTADYSSPDEPDGRARLSADGITFVAGTSYRQRALRELMGGRVATDGDYDDAVPVEAVLVPEPGNPYDVNAVRVDVDGVKVGYLSGGNAERQRPVLDRLWSQRGALGVCPGRIIGGGDRYYGVRLHVNTQSSRPVLVNSADGLTMVEPYRMVSVTRTKEHQGVLERAVGEVDADEGGMYPRVVCGLSTGVVAGGKYAGEPCIAVLVDGETVGELTAKMSARHMPLLEDRSVRVGCEGLVRRRREDGRLELKVMLPEP